MLYIRGTRPKCFDWLSCWARMGIDILHLSIVQLLIEVRHLVLPPESAAVEHHVDQPCLCKLICLFFKIVSHSTPFVVAQHSIQVALALNSVANVVNDDTLCVAWRWVLQDFVEQAVKLISRRVVYPLWLALAEVLVELSNFVCVFGGVLELVLAVLPWLLAEHGRARHALAIDLLVILWNYNAVDFSDPCLKIFEVSFGTPRLALAAECSLPLLWALKALVVSTKRFYHNLVWFILLWSISLLF